MPIRRNWSYWLAVAIALAVLAYLTWQALTEPSSIPDKAKEQLGEKQGILESAYLAAAYPPIPLQDLESRAVLAEAKTQLRVRMGAEMIAHHPVLDSHGSPVWPALCHAKRQPRIPARSATAAQLS